MHHPIPEVSSHVRTPLARRTSHIPTPAITSEVMSARKGNSRADPYATIASRLHRITVPHAAILHHIFCSPPKFPRATLENRDFVCTTQNRARIRPAPRPQKPRRAHQCNFHADQSHLFGLFDFSTFGRLDVSSSAFAQYQSTLANRHSTLFFVTSPASPPFQLLLLLLPSPEAAWKSAHPHTRCIDSAAPFDPAQTPA